MRIVLDGRMITWTGIGRYTRRLFQELATIDTETEYVVLLREADAPAWTPPGPNFSSEVAELRPYGWKEHVLLPAHLRKLRPDLVHFTHFNVPAAYYGNYVVTVQDLTLLRFPAHPDRSSVVQAARLAKRALARQIMRRAVLHATRVLTPSSFTASDVVDTFGVPRERVKVIYYASDPPASRPEPVRGVPHGAPFLLYVGNTLPHKNLASLVKAMEQLTPEHPELLLVMAGAEGEWSEVLEKQIAASSARDRTIFTGPVTDEQLEWLYQNAVLFVFPSLVEGFGLTGLEAMARGVPVAVADNSCLPEIYGEAAEYFDPHDVTDIASTIAKLLGDSNRRGSLARAGQECIGRYSWVATAEATLASYREALLRPRTRRF